MCGIKKAFLDLLMKYCVRRNFQKKPTNTVIYAAFSRKVFLISEAYFKENVFLNWVIAAKEMEEDEGRNTSEAWGLPISNVDTFSNLTDSQFLVRVLGPKHMGYEVSFEGDAWRIMSFHLVFKSLLKIQFQWLEVWCVPFFLCKSGFEIISIPWPEFLSRVSAKFSWNYAWHLA